MFSALEAIFRQAEQEEGVVYLNELGTVFEEADARCKAGYIDVEALRNAKGILHTLWESHSRYLVDAANVLADASRDRMLRYSL